jgi:hypothetical protein
LGDAALPILCKYSLKPAEIQQQLLKCHFEKLMLKFSSSFLNVTLKSWCWNSAAAFEMSFWKADAEIQQQLLKCHFEKLMLKLHQGVFEQKTFDAYSTARLSTSVLANLPRLSTACIMQFAGMKLRTSSSSRKTQIAKFPRTSKNRMILDIFEAQLKEKINSCNGQSIYSNEKWTEQSKRSMKRLCKL